MWFSIYFRCTWILENVVPLFEIFLYKYFLIRRSGQERRFRYQSEFSNFSLSGGTDKSIIQCTFCSLFLAFCYYLHFVFFRFFISPGRLFKRNFYRPFDSLYIISTFERSCHWNAYLRYFRVRKFTKKNCKLESMCFKS